MFPWSSDRNVREYAKAASRYYEILRQREESQMTNNDHIERTKRMIEVMQAYVDGEKIEYKLGNEWEVNERPVWNWPTVNYRIAKKPDTINWDHVAPEFKYMARDEDGDVFLFTEKPEKLHNYWRNGYKIPVIAHSSYRKGTVDWKESLVIRPGCE